MRTTLWVAAAALAVASVAVLAAPAPAAPRAAASTPARPRPEPRPALLPDSLDAPDLRLPTLDGRTFDLDDHLGKVVVVNFWATWCPPCRIEIPDFIEVHDEFRGRDVVFVGVSLDEGGWDDVRPVAEQLGIPYAVALDDGSADAGYGPIDALPATFLIDRHGHVFAHAPGMLTKEALRPAIEAALDFDA